jgi:phosphocarrier protein HPr
MIKQNITIQNKLGLHARASAKLVGTAQRFASRIELVFQDRKVDCKSIMGVITLGAKKDNIIELLVDGEDEQSAIAAIEKVVNDKFGEEQ